VGAYGLAVRGYRKPLNVELPADLSRFDHVLDITKRLVYDGFMVNVELPADLTAQFDSENVSQEAARLLALELFREQKVSLGRASELCSMPLAAFMKFSAAHGVPPMTYSLDDLEADHKTIERLGL
jgi:predicted HTH domain antitoxin